jgi:arylformamidase
MPGSDGAVSAEALRRGITHAAFTRAVVVRTLPNDVAKQQRDWDTFAVVPFLSVEAAAYLADIGCDHVVLDLPSADPLADGGKLLAHRAFFGSGERAKRTTITELAYIPDVLGDGTYLLDLQIPALVADAAPSRPFLFPLRPL